MILDLAMARDGLTGSTPEVLIPIVTATVPDQDASVLLELADKIDSLHAILNSATFRTPGTWPPARSSYRSFRFS